MNDATVNAALLSANLPCVPCGLNADWSVSAWFFGVGKPNANSEPALYLLDTENGAYAVVNAFYLGDYADISDVTSGSLADCVAYLRSEFGIA